MGAGAPGLGISGIHLSLPIPAGLGGQPRVLSQMLRAKADVQSEDGQTALEIAQQNGNDSATRTLQLLQRTSAVTNGPSPPQLH